MLLLNNVPHHAGFFGSCWKVCARKWYPTCLHDSESDGPSVTWVLTALVIGIKSSADDKMLKHFLQPISKPLAIPHSSPVCVSASGNFARKQWATSFLFFVLMSTLSSFRFHVGGCHHSSLQGCQNGLKVQKGYNCKHWGEVMRRVTPLTCGVSRLHRISNPGCETQLSLSQSP